MLLGRSHILYMTLSSLKLLMDENQLLNDLKNFFSWLISQPNI